VSPDNRHAIFSFEMTPEMEEGLRTSEDYWQRMYAPGTGVSDTLGNMYVFPRDGFPALRVLQGPGPSMDQSAVGGHHNARAAFLNSMALLCYRAYVDTIQHLFQYRMGLYMYIGRHSSAQHVPRIFITSFSSAAKDPGFNLERPEPFMTLNLLADGKPVPLELSMTGNTHILNVTYAWFVDPCSGNDPGDKSSSYRVLELGTLHDPTDNSRPVIKSKTEGLYNREDCRIELDFGVGGRYSCRWVKHPEPAPDSLRAQFLECKHKEKGFHFVVM
jgi:hypothetical protein